MKRIVRSAWRGKIRLPLPLLGLMTLALILVSLMAFEYLHHVNSSFTLPSMTQTQSTQVPPVQQGPVQPSQPPGGQTLDAGGVKTLFAEAVGMPFQADPTSYSKIWSLSDPSNSSPEATSFQHQLASTQLVQHVVKRGDTLWDIAQETYHDPYKWSVVAAMNHISNPRLLPTDITLALP